MNTIWKFPIEITAEKRVSLPENASILTVQTQKGVPHIWALLDSGAQLVDRIFAVYGTGHRLPKDMSMHKYIGTFQMSNNLLVFHLFEIKEIL